ncbi:MAG: LysM peptidoglycan-binding domain-containing protein [Elusimicrobiota bacterium]
MNEKEPEKEIFKTGDDVYSSVPGKTAKQAPGAVFGDESAARSNTAEALAEKLKSAALKNAGAARLPERDSSREIFLAQEKAAGKKNASRTLGKAALAVIDLAGIGYPAKLAYEGKLESGQLTRDYKSLQAALTATNKRDYALYKKIFPQVGELENSRIDSALKGIEENLDLAAKMNADAAELWSGKQYDQAMDLYGRAVKINPLNDSSAYITKGNELARQDQEYFRWFYIVQKGDTLESLSKRAKVPAQRIINANGPKYPALYQGRLAKGMRLALPVFLKRVEPGK